MTYGNTKPRLVKVNTRISHVTKTLLKIEEEWLCQSREGRGVATSIYYQSLLEEETKLYKSGLQEAYCKWLANLNHRRDREAVNFNN